MRVVKIDQKRIKVYRREEPPPLIGDRIANLTKAVGIQPCGGCNKRKEWLNDKHQKLRDALKPKVEEV